ncbi:hypothetical protein Holit_03408 [Hollandina sp. SP2]
MAAALVPGGGDAVYRGLDLVPHGVGIKPQRVEPVPINLNLDLRQPILQIHLRFSCFGNPFLQERGYLVCNGLALHQIIGTDHNINGVPAPHAHTPAAQGKGHAGEFIEMAAHFGLDGIRAVNAFIKFR